MKFLIVGPVTVLRLVVVRAREGRILRRSGPPEVGTGGDEGQVSLSFHQGVLESRHLGIPGRPPGFRPIAAAIGWR